MQKHGATKAEPISTHLPPPTPSDAFGRLLDASIQTPPAQPRAHDKLVGKHVSAPVLDPRRRTVAASAAAVVAVAAAAAGRRLEAAVVLPSASIRAALRLPDPPPLLQ